MEGGDDVSGLIALAGLKDVIVELRDASVGKEDRISDKTIYYA